MSTILAIDPGSTESAYVIIETATCGTYAFGKVPNRDLKSLIWRERYDYQRAAVEMVASYGMAVGAEVFETCVWIGRFVEAIEAGPARPVELVKRHPVKVHHCHSAKAGDSNVRQALVDRFAPGQSNHGKGTKADPGWFYGFHSDIWQAYALAVYVADQLAEDGAA